MGWREGRLGLRLVRGRGLCDGREVVVEGKAEYEGYISTDIAILPVLRARNNFCGTNFASEIAQRN